MLTLTCLKISRISPVDFPFFPLANLWGNGALGTYSLGLVSLFFLRWWVLNIHRYDLIFFCHRHLHFVVDFFSFSQGHDCFDLSMLLWWTGTYFMHSLGLGTGWLGNFPFSTVIAKVWTKEASCPTIFSRLETDWACELKPALNSFRSPSMVRFCCSIVEWVTFLRFWNPPMV